MALGVLLTVYVAVAALNYSVVQSYLGTAASRYFSREWGCELHIGSLHAMPWDHLILDDVLLVAPRGDTIFRGDALRVRFRRFPFSNGELSSRLDLDRVYLKNAYYHFEKYTDEEYGGEGGINLQFIIDYYSSRSNDEDDDTPGKPFAVNVRSLTLDNVHYKMDLPDYGEVWESPGVDIMHMEYLDIHGRFRNVHVVGPDVTVKIVKLSTTERSGFRVENVTGDVHVSPQDITVRGLDVETAHSHIMADTRMTYPDWMGDYVHVVQHEALVKEGTTVNLSDVAYWAPVLWGNDVQLRCDGSFGGKIDSIVVDRIWVGYGGATTAEVTARIMGLPDIEQTVFEVERLDVRGEESDMRRLEEGLAAKLGVDIVEQLRRSEYLDLHVQGQGGIWSDAAASVDLTCSLGNLRADIANRVGVRGRRLTVEANSDGLGLAPLGSEWLTHSGIALSAEAFLPNKINSVADIDGTARVELTNSVVRGNRLMPIDIDIKLAGGHADVEATSTDSLLQFDLACSADLGDSLNRYSADLRVDRLEGAAFKLTSEKYSTIGTRIAATATGNDIDALSGSVVARNTHVGPLHLHEVRLDVDADGQQKTLRLDSDPMVATAYGTFSYANLPLMIQHLLATALPAELQVAQPLTPQELESIADNTLHFNAQWTDDGRFLRSVADGVVLARGTRISGSYNSAELLKTVLRSDSVRMGNLALHDIGLSSRLASEAYVVELETQTATIGKLELLSDAGLTLNSNSRRAIVGLKWGDATSTSRGDLMLKLQEGLINVERSHFVVDSTPWTLAIDSLAIERDKYLTLSGSGIELHSAGQKIEAAVRLQRKPSDCVELRFDHFDIGGPGRLLAQSAAIDITGQVDGHFNLYGLAETPYFNANLTVGDCHINRQALGDVAVRSNWNAELNTLNLQLRSDQLAAQGWLDLGKEDPGLNFAVDFDSFDLSLAAPFMTAFTSRFEGMLHGNFDIGGTTAAPVVVGEALVENGALKVDATGVTYYFSDSIRFASNTVRLDRFKVLDPRGNIAYLDGAIRYSDLSDATLDLGVQTDNLLMLDLPYGDSFFGTLLASARGTVRGKLDDLNIKVAATTRPGSSLSVPVNEQRQVKTQNYITFVDDRPVATREQDASRSNRSGINVELDLSINPDVKLNIPMDFTGVAVTVGATGTGDLHMNYDGVQTPQVLGSYEITNGTMKVSLLSVVDKNFTLESGSSLGFQGSVPDARFDMRAVYSQRVNLSTLTGSLSTLDNTQKYIQVENVIAVSGTLQDPTISFDLRLPGADQSVEDEVFAYIDRNSERDMLNQTLSLLVSGNFYNVSGTDQGNPAASGLGSIASTLGGMMADMVNIVDINVDYRAATEMTNQQLDLNISKDWGRWYIESTLGYGGESRELEASNTGGTVIDALLGYRLSPLVHLYAYNRTNTNDYTRMDLPYKQGVGLKLTKDFDRWGDLFRRKKKLTSTQEKKRK